MTKLKLVSLVCHRTQDTSESDEHAFDMTVSDEPYLLVDHKRVWGVKPMSANDKEDLSGLPPIEFHTSVRIELWDKDAGFYPDDDHIGSLTVQATQAGIGELTHEFKRGSAKYTLTYKVEK